MNDYGKLVGFSASPACCSYLPVAWYTSGGVEEIGPYPNGTALTAIAVANTGQAVGTGLINDVGGAQRAVLYRWSTQSMTNLGQLGGNSSAATAISGRGTFITGWSQVASGDNHAFLYQTWPMKDLGTLGEKTSQATGVNESSEVVGYSTTASGVQHAFVYRQGKLVDLGYLAPRPDWSAGANGINDRVKSSGTRPRMWQAIGPSVLSCTPKVRCITSPSWSGLPTPCLGSSNSLARAPSIATGGFWPVVTTRVTMAPSGIARIC